ncbi:hypothetical protein AB0D56_27040 [Streptomyces sp. NPDC048209]|uniref:hypothetical protein n=1 Tax=Streptomyces sp. NPDC048209 TaxID=3156689 RepID=UPI00341C5417
MNTADAGKVLKTGVEDVRTRLIDNWFPCAVVDEACSTPTGSGRNEKAIFPWFASRPIAQARAAVLTTLLPADDTMRPHVEAAVRSGSAGALDRLSGVVRENYGGRDPVVLDLFSGRGIIPLEAARLGVTSVGTDLSPVATLAGRLLADWPLRDWNSEPQLPFAGSAEADGQVKGTHRLADDARILHEEIGKRVRKALEKHYPRDASGRFPWGYLWAVSMPCDQCRRRFPLVGSLALRHPYQKTFDAGQSLQLTVIGDEWRAEVVDGIPSSQPTYMSAGKKGKSARCLFCGHVHSLETVKAKGFAGQYRDEPLAVADFNDNPEKENDTKKIFRVLRDDERRVALELNWGDLAKVGSLSPVPDEDIPPNNVHTVQASGYGYMNYGQLMVERQQLHFGTIAQTIRECYAEMVESGVSAEYSRALIGYASSTLARMTRYATRGARLRAHGNTGGTGQNRVQVGDVFVNEASLSFQFDYFEAGIGEGPGTWNSVAETGLKPLATHLRGLTGKPARLRRANAMAVPYRDGSVDAVICDPPYYDMIEYADASDYYYVWIRRILADIQPDLFGEDVGTVVGSNLQNKDDEIIVRRVYNGGVKHDKEFYENSLSKAFKEARRVLRRDGHLVVVFGHSDPEAWKRLLAALHDAGFVITSSWPSRTENSHTGVASIKVTVTIGCRVAPLKRGIATAAQVDREVTEAVKSAVRDWERDGLAFTDQLMAAIGQGMEVYGKYSKILKPDGTAAELDRYLTLSRVAVRDAMALKLDELPLETFDKRTRFAVFWLRLNGLMTLSKGESRFLAQADSLSFDDVRARLLKESNRGFKLRLDPPDGVSVDSSTIEVARAMAGAWDQGGTEAVASVIATAEFAPNDPHLWAVVGEMVTQLPPSDKTAKALTAIQRNLHAISNLAQRVAETAMPSSTQLTFANLLEESS